MRARVLSADDLGLISTFDWVDHSRKVFLEGDSVYVPVLSGHSYDTCVPDRQRRGRGYQRLGDTILFHGRRPDSDDVADLMVREQPTCILFIPGHSGSLRIPAYEVIYGSPHEVLHRECGISYRLDPTKVMFSQGNRGEKQRMRSLISSSGKEERIADMFAGIGYFTLTAADAGGMVHAMELNPDSFGFLMKNIDENGLTEEIRAECGDCRDMLSGTYDRVIMGHFEATEYLDSALLHVAFGSVIHLHTLSPDEGDVRSILHEHGYDADISVHKVKKYAPQCWHCVMDLVIG
ncbi:MAG: SAM-dependent methyltransferase [Methanocalculus sp.]|uniref:class I SAM-dependent methyltransferase n=1 Tax=Methanocalculus sp. TaxID=2004547 RepID=UPI0027187196|nr:SAM-dependent methyltransferase [Methanocalculus sp.]MDO9539544.1 SAM-dependent methyltransferase [Methanocalculus sp.]